MNGKGDYIKLLSFLRKVRTAPILKYVILDLNIKVMKTKREKTAQISILADNAYSSVCPHLN